MKWYLFLIFGVCCISTSAILITLADVPPTQSAFYRNFFASLFWLIPYGFTRPFTPIIKKKTPSITCRLESLNSLFEKLNGPLVLLILGFFFAVDLWAWHRAIIYIGAGPATLIANLQVVFVALLAVFLFGDTLAKTFWPGTLLAILGIAMLTLTNPLGSNVLLGIISAIATAFAYSLFIILLKYLEQYSITPQQTLFWLAAITSSFLFIPTIMEEGLIIHNLRATIILMVHALISSVIGWWVIVISLKKVPVAVASTMLLLQPLLTSIWGDLFLGQNLVTIQIIGICLALLGIRLANWSSHERQ